MRAKASRLFYTLWPLKLIQHWGLFYYRVVRRFVPFRPTQTRTTGVEQHGIAFPAYQPLGWHGGMRFEFLNRAAEVQASSWQAEEQSLLWHYNLHYFDHLNALNNPHSPAAEAELIRAWWQVHQPQQGVAWEPYPASLRAVNLCKWGWAHNAQFAHIAADEWLALLDRHYQEVKRKLEYHIQANHLFANLKALWFLQAALPDYRVKEAGWLCRLLLQELRMQFDADGGHFELSPMYHRIMLWDVLDMLKIGREVAEFRPALAAMEELLPSAVRWMKALAHPDTEVAFFNDACTGIAPKLAELLDYATQLDTRELPVHNDLYSGYAVARLGKATLLCDAAEVGPDFQPGHAHADSLSFELSIGQQRVVVNSGTSEYGASPERLRQRGTAAHSTLCLADKNSSDVWSGFRVGKQARIIERSLKHDAEQFCLAASHNGYAPAIHSRRWQLSRGQLKIEDELAEGEQKQSRLYFHPDVQVELLDNNAVRLQWAEGSAQLEIDCPGAQIQLQKSSWHPAFNSCIENLCLVVDFTGEHCRMVMEWEE